MELVVSEQSKVEAFTALDVVEARLLQVGGEYRSRGSDFSFAPVTHRFTPGLYIREIFMPAGAILTSETHRTENPFVVSAGRAYVYLENERRWELIQAPHTGITKPGTRRFLVIVEDMIWLSFHVTNKTDVREIEDDLILPNRNPLLEDILPEITA